MTWVAQGTLYLMIDNDIGDFAVGSGEEDLEIRLSTLWPSQQGADWWAVPSSMNLPPFDLLIIRDESNPYRLTPCWNQWRMGRTTVHYSPRYGA